MYEYDLLLYSYSYFSSTLAFKKLVKMNQAKLVQGGGESLDAVRSGNRVEYRVRYLTIPTLPYLVAPPLRYLLIYPLLPYLTL